MDLLPSAHVVRKATSVRPAVIVSNTLPMIGGPVPIRGTMATALPTGAATTIAETIVGLPHRHTSGMIVIKDRGIRDSGLTMARTVISVPPATVTLNTLAMIVTHVITMTALPTVVMKAIAVTAGDRRLRRISTTIATMGRNTPVEARAATSIGVVRDMTSVVWDRVVRRLVPLRSHSTG